MTTPRHLSGNYAPVLDELTAYDLPVTGTIPPELAGWYLRNGPNPADAASGHWFFGDGMVHGVRLEGGRCRTATAGSAPAASPRGPSCTTSRAGGT